MSTDGCAVDGARHAACRDVSVTRDVRVAGLGDDLFGVRREQPSPGVVHQASVAARVDGVARDELLLRDGRQRVAGEEPLALDAARGRE